MLQDEKVKKGTKEKLRKYLWAMIFVTNIVAILMLLGATQAWNFLPSKAPLFSLLGMGFPILLFINIIYLVFWIFTLKWQYALAEIIVLFVCWTPIQTYIPMHSKQDYVPEESFKVLSYNVRHFNWLTGKDARENPIFDYILEQNPDIVCFQEFAAAKKKTNNGLITKEEIDKKFKGYHTATVQLGNRNSAELYGLVIYSKFPIKKTAEVVLWSTFNGCAFHELDINGKTVTLVNTHLESNRITSDDKKLYKEFLKSREKVSLNEVADNIQNKLSTAFTIREDQTALIRAHMDQQKSDAIIVCGDFNDTPISYAYKMMKGDLVDSFAATGRGFGITYNENMFLFRIDYIFHSLRLKSYNTTVGDRKYSDHYPIWSNLMFK